jgi:hypothetical protein
MDDGPMADADWRSVTSVVPVPQFKFTPTHDRKITKTVHNNWHVFKEIKYKYIVTLVMEF